MSKLFVRLAASGTIAASLSAAALADNASIDMTGPWSTNTVISNNRNTIQEHTRNFVALGNWNNQWAKSGNVRTSGNTSVWGGSGGSGSAMNENSADNSVDISNSGSGDDQNFGSGSLDATISLTGPHSTNRISSSNQNTLTENTTNNVRTANFNDQFARSGNVTISGNTRVEGGGASGDAVNTNTGSNDVNITNNNSGFGTGNSGDNSATIDTTGPGSRNQINFSNTSRTNIITTITTNTTNNIQALNASHQNATTGNVTITGNTVVSGDSTSGSAVNDNTGSNNIDVSSE